LHHRVEVSFPIKEQTLKDQIITIINFQLADNMNAVTLDEQMQNNPVPPAEPAVNAQLSTYHQVATWNSPEENQ
ncbi:MAG: hypothetical protein AAGA85_16655, partial [Bacteroidota bacterium]